jgi:NAD(P)-dependent dehydrogenase (short-subunit alcohol dehydrogenase family)
MNDVHADERKVALVTGATNGHGLAVARALARAGWHVIVHGRAPDRVSGVQRTIAAETGREPEALLCDLASGPDIDRAAAELIARDPDRRLHLLVNNAGGVWPRRVESAEGVEMTFAVNYLAAFRLTLRLVDLLKRSAPARIVNVSSDMHRLVSLDPDDPDLSDRRHSWARAYSNSKLALVHFTRELARRLEGTGVTVNAVDPGPVRSGIGRNNGDLVDGLLEVLMRFFPPADDACRTALRVATAPELEGVTGRYFRFMVEKPPSLGRGRPTLGAELWRRSVELTGVDLA